MPERLPHCTVILCICLVLVLSSLVSSVPSQNASAAFDLWDFNIDSVTIWIVAKHTQPCTLTSYMGYVMGGYSGISMGTLSTEYQTFTRYNCPAPGGIWTWNIINETSFSHHPSIIAGYQCTQAGMIVNVSSGNVRHQYTLRPDGTAFGAAEGYPSGTPESAIDERRPDDDKTYACITSNYWYCSVESIPDRFDHSIETFDLWDFNIDSVTIWIVAKHTQPCTLTSYMGYGSGGYSGISMGTLSAEYQTFTRYNCPAPGGTWTWDIINGTSFSHHPSTVAGYRCTQAGMIVNISSGPIEYQYVLRPDGTAFGAAAGYPSGTPEAAIDEPIADYDVTYAYITYTYWYCSVESMGYASLIGEP